MDFHRRSSCTKELRFRTLVILVLLVFVSITYCQQFNATNSSRFTVECENEKHAENQSELSYIDCKCWHDRPDGHWQQERLTKECSSNKTNGKVELTLSQKPNRRYLVEGSMISFMCCSRSWFYQTSKEFQWRVDGRRIRNTGNETMISNNTQYDDNNTICSNLTIDSIGISVTIQCVVNHRYFDTDGTIENSLSLRLHPCVLPRPFVILSPKTPLADDSQMFELSCHLTSSGEEGANFIWYQNGSPINSSFGSVNISLPELKISQLQTSLRSQTDPVKFGCMAKTKLGDTAIQNFTVVSHYNEAYCKSDDYVKELAVPRSLMKIRFDNLQSCPDKVEITLRQEPAETYLVEGNNILLICCFRCWLDRYKVREFQWTVYNLTTRNLTRVIKTNDTHVYYDVNNTICSNQTFDQLSPGLETVQCTVNYNSSNNNGTVDDNLSLRLHLCVLQRPFVTVNPKDLSVYDSQTFALSCQLTSAIVEGANVTWYKDGVLISSVSGSMPNRRQIMSNVSMSLQSQMDAVIFSCMAETRLGSTDLQNSTIAIFDNIGKYCENGDYSVGPTVPPITISEHHQSGNASLTLSWEPNKKYLIDGDSISWKCCFKCECILKNVSDIQWMVNDRIITHNTHQKTISNTSCGSMLVFNADMNLETIQCERNYTCSYEGNNSTHDEGNNSTHDAYLNKRIDPCVLPQPFVTINPKTLRVNDSQMFELSCYLTSAIQECARFTWYKDGNPIDSSSGSVYISYPRLGMSQLQTSLPLRMNPYTISCNATTKLGNTNRQNSTVIVFDYSGQYCKSDDYDRELAVLQSHKKILFNNSTNCPKTEKGKVEITLRQRPTKKYLVVGDRISLICCFRCWFNRYEAREFQWTFDNQTIRSNWTQMMTISDTYYDVNNSLCSNLTFDQISNGSGTVQCTVNNTYYDNNRPFNDTLRLSLYLFVFPRPFVVINPKSVNVIHFEEFALSCYLTSAVEEGTNFTWYKDGVPINISSEENLTVSSPKLNKSQLHGWLHLQRDPVIFGCMAETELGRTGLQNSTIVVVDANDKYCKRNDYDRELSVRQNYMKIRFAILPSSCPNIETGKVELTLHQESITKYLVEGNRISLICCFRAWYNSSRFGGFQWTFNGQRIRNNWTQVTYDTYDVNGATCSNQTFDSISPGSGNVQCNASYSYNDSSNTIKDHLSLSLYLCVFPRPYVTISPKTLLVNDSDMFDFSCHLTSAIEEGANFTWYQDGELIDPFCGGTNITSQGLNTSLLQTSVRLQSHPITFSCVADTQLGMTSLSNSEVTIFDYNAKYCESEQDATMKSINWNRMKVRNVDSHPCQVKGSEGGFCSRMCSLNETSHPVWDAPNCAMCVSVAYRELLQRLEQIQPNQNTTMVAVDIAKNLSALTAQNDTLTQYNLNASLNVISNLTKIRHNETAGVEEVEAVIDVISNLLRPNNSGAWTQLQKENRSVTVSLLRFAEYYGSSLSKTLNNTNKSIIINSDNVVLVAYSMDQSELVEGRDFPASLNSTETRGDKISISINISSLSENRTHMLQVKIFTSYYRNIEDKLPSSNSGIVQSRVLSLTIIDEQGKSQNLMKPVVVVTLQHSKPICRSFERTCSFWNFTEGARVWDATGCSLISTNETHTVCSCNHLTNFAILMSRNPSNSSVLSTMSAVGCSISVTCLILTVIIYIVNWTQWKSDQSAVLLNLCVALIIANIIFLVGSDKTGLPDNAGPPDENCIPDGCKAVAVLLHYFFLAAFFLMLAEGIELLLYIIFVFHVRRKIETASIIAAAWGCPLIIVVISFAVKGMKGYISEYNVCWLSIENGLIWAFAGPAFCIILVNFLILAIIMRRISRARFGATEFEKKRRLRATLWNISVICPVLGVTWAFGILSFSFDHEIFQYLFVVANSLQGMLIFLYHAVLRNKKISEGCCKPKKPKPVSVTHTNPQPTEKEEKKEEKKEEDKEEKTEEKKEEKKEEVTEEKIECVAKLVNFFMSLEKSGGFDASRSFMTTLSLSTEEQSLMNDSEVSVTAAVHSSSDDAPGTSDPDGVAPGGVAPGGVALDGVASDGADSCGIAPGGVVSGEFALGDVAPGGVSQGGITTVEIASDLVAPGMVFPDKAVVTEIPTVQEN